MRLQKLNYDPAGLADFYAEALQSAGAVCERSWHDRLQVLAEGAAASHLWRQPESVYETELRFSPAGDTHRKDAARDVFPGAPLTFRLAEFLWGRELVIERVALRFPEHLKPPAAETAERLWHSQFPNSGQWRQRTPFVASWCFSLLAIVRCEVQAIDQSWSLHRIALSLPEGDADDKLAASLEFAEEIALPGDLAWPTLDLQRISAALARALDFELQTELASVRDRQQAYLRRELERIDDYFAKYTDELTSRSRGGKEAALKLQDRLKATVTEHERRRHDQLQRHAIRVTPHPDALLLVAEPCWRAQLQVTMNHAARLLGASFVPRARAWRDLQDEK